MHGQFKMISFLDIFIITIVLQLNLTLFWSIQEIIYPLTYAYRRKNLEKRCTAGIKNFYRNIHSRNRIRVEIPHDQGFSEQD